ncbi:MAG: peptidoglycan-associated lipoprotein Pal [Gammaproteobacteria bacterium]
MKKILVFLSIAITAASLSGCQSAEEFTRTSDEGTVTEGEPGEDEEGARPHGVDESGGPRATGLNDPQGRLSVRVIYFDYDSSDVKPEYQPVIEAHAQYLTQNPNAVLTLEGHTDERGSREYNLALGERRAQAVSRQLVLLGASNAQVRTLTYGEERPVTEGHEEQAYAVNRRAELVY